MAAGIIVPIGLFALIFGIAYLYFITRHRERIALIEKEQDASVFYSSEKYQMIRRYIVLNIALTAIGIGLGIGLAIVLHGWTGEEAVYPASVFCMAGLGLLVSYFINRKHSHKSPDSTV